MIFLLKIVIGLHANFKVESLGVMIWNITKSKKIKKVNIKYKQLDFVIEI